MIEGVNIPSSLLSPALRIAAAIALLLPAQGWTAAATVPAAVDLAARYPVGGIVNGEQARAAQAEADRADAAAQTAWRDAQERCAHMFFVTSCRDQALKARREVEREARRVRVEANAVERRLDAQARAQDKAEQAARAPSPEQRAERESAARVEWQALQQRALDNAADREQRARDAAQRKKDLAQRMAEQQRRESERASQEPARADNVRQFEARQREAALHADEKARERAVNERKRAERLREREKKMAEQGIVPPVSVPGASTPPAPTGAPGPHKGPDLPPDIPPPPPPPPADLPADMPPPPPAPR
jgi:hypothetical protein